MSEIKPTPGPWSVCEHSWCETSIRAPSTGHALCRLDINHATEESQEADEAQMAANARLIAEAGTVHHETGLTPRQLVERVKELEEATVDFLEAQGALDHRELMGINAEPYEVLMRRRNAARADLEAALSKPLPNTVAEVK